MKNVLSLAVPVLVLAACAAAKPIDPPGDVPPGQSSPASPSSAWSTQGGPASPGSPSMGTIHTADAGADSGKP